LITIQQKYLLNTHICKRTRQHYTTRYARKTHSVDTKNTVRRQRDGQQRVAIADAFSIFGRVTVTKTPPKGRNIVVRLPRGAKRSNATTAAAAAADRAERLSAGRHRVPSGPSVLRGCG